MHAEFCVVFIWAWLASMPRRFYRNNALYNGSVLGIPQGKPHTIHKIWHTGPEGVHT